MGDIANAVGGKGVDASRRDDAPQEGEGFKPLPAGWYPISIDKVELRDTKPKGNRPSDGKYVWCQATVLGNRFAKRKLFFRFNIVNPSAEAVRIGQRDLGRLGNACGIPIVSESKELLNKQVDVRVRIKDDDNDATDFAKFGTKSAEGQAGAPASGGAPPAKRPDKPAWEKKAEQTPPAGSAEAPAQAPAADAGAAGETKAPPVEAPPPAKVPGKRPWENKK